MSWKKIDSDTPRDRSILLYWPCYSYDGSTEDVCKRTAIGCWKQNRRLGGMGYFSDNDEMDDYGLAMGEFAPTHWQEIPDQPESGP